MTPAAPRPHSFAHEAFIFAGRLFTHWRRYPVVPIQSLLFPTVLVITYSLLVSKSMARIAGTNRLELLIPICALAGAMAGTLGAAFVVSHDRNSGLLTRLWVLPVGRFSALGGTLLAEGLRTLVGTTVLTLVGLLLGFRFHSGPLAFVVFLLIPVAVIMIYALIVISIATRTETRTLLTWLNTVVLGLVFGSAAPAHLIPAAVRPIARHQPMASIIETMRALAQGESATVSLIVTTVWLLLLAAIFGPLAMSGYRRAAQTPPVQ